LRLRGCLPAPAGKGVGIRRSLPLFLFFSFVVRKDGWGNWPNSTPLLTSFHSSIFPSPYRRHGNGTQTAEFSPWLGDCPFFFFSLSLIYAEWSAGRVFAVLRFPPPSPSMEGKKVPSHFLREEYAGRGYSPFPVVSPLSFLLWLRLLSEQKYCGWLFRSGAACPFFPLFFSPPHCHATKVLLATTLFFFLSDRI